MYLSREGDDIRAEISSETQGSVHINGLRLRPEDEVSIGVKEPKRYTLKHIVECLASSDWHALELFESRGQLDLGAHLFAETLEKVEAIAGRENVHMRIESDDEYLLRLPWVLMNRRGEFLVRIGWSIARGTFQGDPELPPSPRLLIAAPEPASRPTGAKNHLADLRSRLIAGDPRMALESHVRVANDTKKFREELEQFQPHVVYFFGHGQGDVDQSHLIFLKGSRPDKVSAIDMASWFEALSERKPLLVYVNACLGDSGGWLGVGPQMKRMIPVVVTNRSLASPEISQEQACLFLEDVILRGHEPDSALAKNYSQVGRAGAKSDNPHWFTPVIYSSYKQWKSNPPKSLTKDSSWVLKVDRSKQIAIVRDQAREMIDQRDSLVAQAFLWYGLQGEGVTLFHRRLTLDLPECMGEAEFYEVTPRWPDAITTLDMDFERMICDAFEVNELNDLTGRLRGRGGNGRLMIHINHTSLNSPKVLTVRRLQNYLRWLDFAVIPLIESGKKWRLIVSVSYELKIKARKFGKGLQKNVVGEVNPSSIFEINLLDQMDYVVLDDLRRFLRMHGVRVPPSKGLEKALQAILERTGGHYEATLPELEKLMDGIPEHLGDEEPEDEEFKMEDFF